MKNYFCSGCVESDLDSIHKSPSQEEDFFIRLECGDYILQECDSKIKKEQ